MPTCTRCKEEKPVGDFSYRQSRCKPCNRICAKDWARANPERRKAWKQANKDRIRAADRRHKKFFADLHSMRTRVRKYGPAAVVVHNYIRSGGVCQAGCGRPSEVVDHCHKSGVVRGALCNQCNRALGGVQDDVTKLEGLIRYLKTTCGSLGA